MKKLPLLFMFLVGLSACDPEAASDPEVVFEPKVMVNGSPASCSDIDAETITVKLSGRDGQIVHALEFDCGGPLPSIAIAPGEWNLRTTIVANGRHAPLHSWITIEDADEVVVPLDFDYATFALDWALLVDGAPSSCADLGSEEISVVYTSHEASRTQTLPCTDASGTSIALPRSKRYQIDAHLSHPSHNYPGWSERDLRLSEAAAPTPLSMQFRLSAAQL